MWVHVVAFIGLVEVYYYLVTIFDLAELDVIFLLSCCVRILLKSC